MKPGVEVLIAAATALLAEPLAPVKNAIRSAAHKDPIDAVVGTVLAASVLFYRAEKGHNPKVVTFADALVYVSTSISVGYSDILPKTEAGKLITTALQTVGPALAARALDSPGPTLPAAETSQAVLDKLDAILVELKAQRAAREDITRS
jgi:voltage-gated potassium channel